MERDGIDRETALEMIDECRNAINEAVEEGNVSEADSIIMDCLGLEPDYIFDILS